MGVKGFLCISLAVWCSWAQSEKLSELRSPAGVCATSGELSARLAEKAHILRNTKDLLEGFLGGSSYLALSPQALFEVDLESESAISSRKIELRKHANNKDFLPPEYVEVEKCIKSGGLDLPLFSKVLELEQQISLLRLEFLSLDAQNRAQLLKKFEAAGGQYEKAANKFSEAVDVAESEQSKARAAKAQAEEIVASGKNAEKVKLAQERAKLEGIKFTLSTIELEITRSLEEKARARSKISEEVTALGNLLVSSDSSAELLAAYKEITSIWRSVGRRTLDLFSQPEVLIGLPELPARPAPLLVKLKDDLDATAYEESHRHAVDLRNDIISLQKDRWEEEVDRNHLLLKQVGKVRSEYLLTLRDTRELSPFTVSDEYVSDLKRELTLVPLRWRALFYSKVVKIKSDLTAGLDGIFSLVKQLLSFLALLIVPFLLVTLSSKLRDSLDAHRENIVRSYRRTKGSIKIALWIQRINPYLVWIVSSLATWVADYLLKNTVLEDFRTFLPYIYYYIGYRVFLQFLDTTFARFALRSRSYTLREIRTRLHTTGKYVGTFFLLGICVLHATESSVGKALVYHLVRSLVFWLGVVILGFAAFFWRQEIRGVVPDFLSGKFGKATQSLLQGPQSFFLALPVLLGLIVIASAYFLWNQLSGFDFFKRASAQLFRQKLESAASDKQEQRKLADLPSDYRTHFLAGAIEEKSTFVKISRDPLPKLMAAINDWKVDPEEENSVAFFGEKGIGKTSALRRLEGSISDVRFVSLNIPGGVTEPAMVTALVMSALGLPESSDLSSMYKWEKDIPKTVVSIDDTHNLFLASVGGFDSYRKFLEFINLPLSNVFWCAAFNLHAWNYLRSVFKRSLFFRHTVLAEKWSDEDIQKLILTRHNKTEYKLSYDDIIYATQSTRTYETENYAETQFFRLLWEQSRGNPTGAMHFWLTSLRDGGAKTFKVGLPEEPSAKGLQDLSIESLLVYASIVRHENLSVQEMIRTTEVSEGLVRQARKVGIERKFLERTPDGRYRVTAGWQYVITNFLINKNLLNVR